MSANVSPFWWVVTARCSWWCPPYDEWHYHIRAQGFRGGTKRQKAATIYVRRIDAVRVARRIRAEGTGDAAMPEAKIIRVRAR